MAFTLAVTVSSYAARLSVLVPAGARSGSRVMPPALRTGGPS